MRAQYYAESQHSLAPCPRWCYIPNAHVILSFVHNETIQFPNVTVLYWEIHPNEVKDYSGIPCDRLMADDRFLDALLRVV
jgi:hypothetical protein